MSMVLPLMEQGASSSSSELQQCRTVIDEVSDSLCEIRSHCFSVVSLAQQWRTLQNSFSLAHDEMERKEMELQKRFEAVEIKERELCDRCERIEVEDERIVTLGMELQRRESEIEERFEVLDSKERDFEERLEVLELKENVIEERFKVLESKEKEIEERFNVVEESVKFVELKEREIEEGCRKLELKNKQIKWILQDLELKKKHINERFEFIELWERELKESELNENLSLMIPVKSAVSTFQKTDIEVNTVKSASSTFQKTDIDVDMVDIEKSAGSTFQKTEDEKKKAATQPEKALSSEVPDSEEEVIVGNLTQPQTTATPKATPSKTLFVANLSFAVKESDVREFFKNAESVRLSKVSGIFKGFAHVEFATAEAAKQAMELNAQPLLGRPVRLEFAHEKPLTPQSRESSSFQRGRAKAQTIFVKGFNTNLDEHAIKSALRKHFGSCGNITKVAIPVNYNTGGIKGMAFMEFADSSSFNAALEKDGSDLGGGYFLSVKVAKSRGDSTDGSDGSRFSGRGGTDGGVTAMASGKTDNIWG